MAYNLTLFKPKSIPILNRGTTGKPFNSPDIRVSIIGG